MGATKLNLRQKQKSTLDCMQFRGRNSCETSSMTLMTGMCDTSASSQLFHSLGDISALSCAIELPKLHLFVYLQPLAGMQCSKCPGTSVPLAQTVSSHSFDGIERANVSVDFFSAFSDTVRNSVLRAQNVTFCSPSSNGRASDGHMHYQNGACVYSEQSGDKSSPQSAADSSEHFSSPRSLP